MVARWSDELILWPMPGSGFRASEPLGLRGIVVRRITCKLIVRVTCGAGTPLAANPEPLAGWVTLSTLATLTRLVPNGMPARKYAADTAGDRTSLTGWPRHLRASATQRPSQSGRQSRPVLPFPPYLSLIAWGQAT